MKKRLQYLGLSLIVSLGIWANRLPAQSPSVEVAPFEAVPPPMYSAVPFYAPQILVAPTIPYEPAIHPFYGSPYAPTPTPTPAKHFYRRAMNHFGMGCQPNLDGNVGNFYSETRFIFGSSRSFFNEVCVPNHTPQR